MSIHSITRFTNCNVSKEKPTVDFYLCSFKDIYLITFLVKNKILTDLENVQNQSLDRDQP